MLFSLYSGGMAIPRQSELKTLSSETGIRALPFHLRHLVDVGPSRYMVTPVASGHTLKSQPVCWYWMVVVLASWVTPSSSTLLKAVCISFHIIFCYWIYNEVGLQSARQTDVIVAEIKPHIWLSVVLPYLTNQFSQHHLRWSTARTIG